MAEEREPGLVSAALAAAGRGTNGGGREDLPNYVAAILELTGPWLRLDHGHASVKLEFQDGRLRRWFEERQGGRSELGRAEA